MRPLCSLAAAAAALAALSTAQAQIPTVETGGTASVYATFTTDPGTISFDASDNLYVGNFNNPGPANEPTDVWVVDAIDSSVTSCAIVSDPDAVYVDRNGLISSPGTVLVGGWQYPTSIGQIVAVASGCGGQAPIAIGGCVGNVTTFAEDSLGNLYISNATENTVCVWDGVTWTEFLPAFPGLPRIAIDGTDIYVSESDVVRLYDTSGALVDSAFTTGTVHSIGPTGTDFEGLIVERTDTLLAVDPVTKAETLILTGPGSTGAMVAFDSAGELYLSQGGTFDRVLHVTQGDPTGIRDVRATKAGPVLRVSPNPAPGRVTVRFSRSKSGPVQLDLFDARGRRVLRIHDGFVPAHEGSWNLDVGSLAGGVYFVSARTREGRTTEKVVLIQ